MTVLYNRGNTHKIGQIAGNSITIISCLAVITIDETAALPLNIKFKKFRIDFLLSIFLPIDYQLFI